MNILDYLDWRGDINFSCSPFNVVDNVILAELAYVNMDDLIGEELSFDDTLAKLLAKYRVARKDQKGASNDPIPVLEKAAYCERFKNVTIGGYTNYYSEDEIAQFSAVTYRLGDGTLYVAYRGTDHTMTGWHEDFNFGFLSKTPGQKRAVEYLERVLRETDEKLYVGGHSKGGNFAVYASVFADSPSKSERIINIFSNDGPGFKKSIINSPEYVAVKDKIIKTVPVSSRIGMLLYGNENITIVESDGKGLDQHSLYNWRVFRDGFVTAEDLTYSSEVLDEILDKWISDLPDEERGTVISSLFKAIDIAGYTSMSEILENKLSAYNALTKASKFLDEKDRKITMDALKHLAGISKDVLWDDAKNKFIPGRKDND